MKYPLSVLAIWLGLLGSARAQDAATYLPMHQLDYWYFKDPVSGAIKGWTSWLITSHVHTKNFPGAYELHLKPSGSTVYGWDFLKDTYEPLFKFSAAVGTKYAVHLPYVYGDNWYYNSEMTVLGKGETFYNSVLDQTFVNCIRFKMTKLDSPFGSLTYVFAPGVGLVAWYKSKPGEPTYAYLLRNGKVNGKVVGLVPFSVLESGSNSSYTILGTYPVGTAKETLVLNSQSTWSDFYKKHKPGAAVPAIDFSKKTVVVAVAERPTSKYSLQVTQVRKNFAPVWIYDSRVWIQENKPGPNVVVSPVTTHPYVIVVVEVKLSMPTQGWKVVVF